MSPETALEKAFAIVAIGGNAKGEAYEALEAAEAGKHAEARQILAQADKDLIEAHNIQTEFIQRAAAGEEIPLSMIFVHAQDHLMCALEAHSLITHLVAQQERIDALETRLAALEEASHGQA